MSDPFLGQIQPFAFPFAPKGWALCDGALLSTSQNQALFALIGSAYGGNGVSTFALPDLRGRVPLGQGSGNGGTYAVGTPGGAESVALTPAQLPGHGHGLLGTSADATLAQVAAGQLLAKATPPPSTPTAAPPYYYGPASGSTVALNAASVTPAGSGTPHENMQPFLVVNWCIAMAGIFPSRT